MKQQLVLTTLAACLTLALGACVTIDINPTTITQADDYDFSAPASPFDDIKAEKTDHAWQSDKTGNTIAIISACNKNADPSLKSFENDTVASLSNTKVGTSEKVMLGKSEALKSLVEGQLDSVNVKLMFYSLKRNNCTYSLAFIAKKDLFDKEITIFETFAQRFKFE